jgi:CRISPR-associated endoribonuclease Cas6
MLVFEYSLRIQFLSEVPYEKTAEKIGYFFDSALVKDEKYIEFHEKHDYKNYVFDLPYPLNKDGVYKSGIYTVRVRTVKQGLAEYFSTVLPFHKTDYLIGISGKLGIIPKKIIENVYTLTPLVIKNDFGYWRKNLSLSEFENRIKVNLIKKYNYLTDSKINEDFQLYQMLEFKNKKPVKTSYKGITLLGDKINFVTCKNKEAQDIWYMALGTGVGENNARGCGFINFRYL